jgi:hypothetical protein
LDDVHITAWEGSDAWVRLQFFDYVQSFLSLITSMPQIWNEENYESTNENSIPLFKESVSLAPANDFNPAWVRRWLQTNSFHHWKQRVDRLIHEEKTPE